MCAWSSTQKVVALSSCESECYSLVRCACEPIGMQETLCELGHATTIRLWTRRPRADLRCELVLGRSSTCMLSAIGCRAA